VIRLVDGICDQRPSCIRRFLFSFLIIPRYQSALAAGPKKKISPELEPTISGPVISLDERSYISFSFRNEQNFLPQSQSFDHVID